MRLSKKFSRFTGAGTSNDLGTDTVPNGANGAPGTPPHGQDNLLVAKTISALGEALSRVIVAYNYVGIGAAVPLTAALWAWDSTTERWYFLGENTLTAGVIAFFDAIALIELAATQENLPRPTQGQLEVVLIVANPGGVPDGEHSFTMSGGISTSAGDSGGGGSTVVAAGSGILVTEAPAGTFTVSADFGTGAGKVLPATKGAIETVLALGTGIVQAAADVLSASTALVALTSIAFTPPVAASGEIRGGTAFAIRALNGVTDVNIASVAAGVVAYGGTANAGVIVGTATGSTILNQVNAVTKLQVDGTGAFVGGVFRLAPTVATNVALTGSLRTSHGTEWTFRNNANTADLAIMSLGTIGIDRLDIGITGATSRPATVGIWAVGVVAIGPSSAGSINTNGFTFSSTGLVFGTALAGASITFGLNPSTIGLLRMPSPAGTFTAAVTFRNNTNSADIGGLGFTSANRLYLGFPVSTEGSPVDIYHNATTSHQTYITGTPRLTVSASETAIAPALKISAATADTVASAGLIRTANAVTIIGSLTSAAASVGILSFSSANVLLVGADAASANLVATTYIAGSSAVGVRAGGTTSAFDFILNASGFNFSGASLTAAILRQGTEAMRFEANNNLSLLGGAGSYGTGAVSNVFIKNGTAPSTNPVGGGDLYCEVGALKYRGPGGTVTTLAPS